MSNDLTVEQEIENLSEEAIAKISFSSPWSYGTQQDNKADADGFSRSSTNKDAVSDDREEIQTLCWSMYHSNPQVNTSVRGAVGRLVGYGFDTSSDNLKINKEIKSTIYDKRNRLYDLLPKYITRYLLEGELFLVLTVHKDGFIEIDFIDPSNVSGAGDEGILYHPSKAWMPLAFNIKTGENGTNTENVIIPSINIAYFPEMTSVLKRVKGFSEDALMKSETKEKEYKKVGGFKRFMLYWDRGVLTYRSTGYLRTVLQWLNMYENLKKYEIDHKKSSGAYLWTFTFTDIKAYKLWLSMTDEQRQNTGIMAKKVPGSALILPPGVTCTVQNPNLPKISDADTDILHMITSGLNEPEDISTGQSGGTFASVKASRAPMSDRVSDEVEGLNKFLIHDFWGSIFHLKNKVVNFPNKFKVEEAVDFKNNEPVFEMVEKTPEEMIEITFPTSELVDYEGRAKSFLGVKHGSTNTTLGLPMSSIAKKLGIYNYKRARLQNETEIKKYPELIETEDDESVQERTETEPAKGKPAAPVKPIVKKPLIKKPAVRRKL